MARRFHSPTSINTYLRCPRKYWLKYIKGLQERPSIHLIRGKAVHEAIARFHQLDLRQTADPERMRAELLSIFDRAWYRQNAAIEGLGLSKAMLHEFYHESTEMLLGWLRRKGFASSDGVSKPQTEVKLFSGTYGAMGIIDTIQKHNGRIHLVDYKTSKTDQITRDIRVQLALYALLYRENFGMNPDTVAVDFLKHQQEKRFGVTERVLQFAIQICNDMHRKTSSTNEKDYPCKCGGFCEQDFIQENGGN
jgi:putative RecB family exonuclease